MLSNFWSGSLGLAPALSNLLARSACSSDTASGRPLRGASSTEPVSLNCSPPFQTEVCRPVDSLRMLLAEERGGARFVLRLVARLDVASGCIDSDTQGLPLTPPSAAALRHVGKISSVCGDRGVGAGRPLKKLTLPTDDGDLSKQSGRWRLRGGRRHAEVALPPSAPGRRVTCEPAQHALGHPP